MQVAATYIAAGVRDVEMPTVAGNREALVAMLHAPITTPAAPKRRVIEAALGLRRAS